MIDIDRMFNLIHIFHIVYLIPYGQGICQASTQVNQTNPRFQDKEDCKELCKRDESCSYVSYRKGEFCKRYSTLTCTLTVETPDSSTDYTYKKIATGNNKSYSTLIKKIFLFYKSICEQFCILELIL